MRVGLIADVHANLPALQATLEHLAAAGVDTIVCAGDLVGYGPHPDACVEVLAGRQIPCVAGDHDLMAVGLLPAGGDDPIARRSQEWTRQAISDATATHLAALPATFVLGPLLITHAALGDPCHEVSTRGSAHRQLAVLAADHPERSILVVGHTHRPALFTEATGTVRRRHRRSAPMTESRALVNPGGVGRPRRWGRAARCAVLDLAHRHVRFDAVPYDDARTRRDLERLGIGARPVDR